MRWLRWNEMFCLLFHKASNKFKGRKVLDWLLKTVENSSRTVTFPSLFGACSFSHRTLADWIESQLPWSLEAKNELISWRSFFEVWFFIDFRRRSSGFIGFRDINSGRTM